MSLQCLDVSIVALPVSDFDNSFCSAQGLQDWLTITASEEELTSGWLTIGAPMLHLSNTKEPDFFPFKATIHSVLSTRHLFIHFFFSTWKVFSHKVVVVNCFFHWSVAASLTLAFMLFNVPFCPAKALGDCRKSGPAKPQRHNPLVKTV